MNPVPDAQGLTLNIDEASNMLDLGLAMSVSAQFRVKPERSRQIMDEVIKAVKGWSKAATNIGIPRAERERMEMAFERSS